MIVVFQLECTVELEVMFYLEAVMGTVDCLLPCICNHPSQEVQNSTVEHLRKLHSTPHSESKVMSLMGHISRQSDCWFGARSTVGK